MNLKETKALKSDLDATYNAFITKLKTGALHQATDKHANYAAIGDKLRSLAIAVNPGNVNEAAVVIGKHKTPPVVIHVEQPPPPFDAVKALSELTAEHGHHATIDGIEVYLDKDQAAHQPTNQPIGARQTSGKNKFKSTLASKPWHEANTMKTMATWAKDLNATKLANGRKEFFGQANDEGGISFEAFCQLISGKRYVSFHCYPCRGRTGDPYRG